MRTTWSAALAAMALAACGQGRNVSVERQAVPPQPGGTQPSAVPCDGRVTVHLDGTDPGAVTRLAVEITGASFVGAGSNLQAISIASGALDVAAACQELAVLPLPASGTVSGWVTLGTTHACVGGSCFDLEACASPLDFQFDAAKVSPERCDVTVRLDLAGSVYAAGDVQAFLPRYSVHY